MPSILRTFPQAALRETRRAPELPNCSRSASVRSNVSRNVCGSRGRRLLAHANRGRPSPDRLPSRVRQALVRLARTTYAGFNDHHLCEKPCEMEGFSLSRETLRRVSRQSGIGSPRKRRAPAHRQRRLRSAREGELVQLDGSLRAEGEGGLSQAIAITSHTPTFGQEGFG